ncbi:MAG: DUF1328 domain-containing protein [Sphingobium phenoxybenzoativorans]
MDGQSWETLPRNDCAKDVEHWFCPQVLKTAYLDWNDATLSEWRHFMFRWAIIFAVVAVVAALLGFGGVAGLSADLAKLFLVVAAIVLVIGFLFGRGTRVP